LIALARDELGDEQPIPPLAGAVGTAGGSAAALAALARRLLCTLAMKLREDLLVTDCVPAA